MYVATVRKSKPERCEPLNRQMTVRILRHEYLPSLHRQKTEKLPQTRLRDEINLTLETVLKEDIKPLESTKKQFLICMNALHGNLKTNPFKLEMKESPIYCGDIPPWKPLDPTIPSYLVPLKVGKMEGRQLEAGYAVFPMPKEKTELSVKVYNLELRSEDRLHLCPRKTVMSVFKVFSWAIQKLNRHYTSMTFETSATGRNSAMMDLDLKLEFRDDVPHLLLILPEGQLVEIIPAIAVTKRGPFYITRPFENDINPNSDMRWRINYSMNEEAIMRAIATGDKLHRLNAAKLLAYICRKEWQLRYITSYHIKTVLLHESDFEIDSTPRWQRFSMDDCLKTLIRRLQDYVRRRELPHFFDEDINLFEHIPLRAFTFMRNALDRLLREDEELARVVQRTRLPKIVY
ncbi:uncharacterized protein LOC127721516 isoform X2 [Mytilus californianus]|uniref:uncharacterized protein LOC127721516 isoform X1 n=1 Tax=Mytilus californianus TaxID=6549 RepID=UPI0022458773|nr:uncharacterized protein LOC127721516 isoform X1 [Mytilus californianus]XP_052084243.1 uncharacterized protein LOC127721516 isoform X2 [Mytilus californianus]